MVRVNALANHAARASDSTIARAAIVFAVLILASRVWPLFHREFNIDEFEHAHASWSLAQGLVPYRDFFEHHPPALYFAFAPLFAGAPVDRDADAALRVLLLCRAAMLALTVAAVGLTYVLARIQGGRLNGAVAVILLVTSEQFLDSMMEFRPDVPAVVCTLLSIVCAVASGRPGARAPALLAVASGALFGAALLCTPKTVFVGAGLLFAVTSAGGPAMAARWAAGILVPFAPTLAWFAARDALQPFLSANIAMNVRLNADGFATLPRLVRHVGHHPALYSFGFAGIATALVRDRVNGVRRTIAAAAAALLVGAFVIGRPYDQYYALMLPLLAVTGAGWAQETLRARPAWTMRPVPRRLLAVAALAGVAAFLVMIRPLTDARGLGMAASFISAVLFAAGAVHVWGARPVAPAVLGFGAMAALLGGNVVREFAGNQQQIADLRWVTSTTAPSDTVLSGIQTVSAFRPHAWFYCFLTGPFPTAAEYAALLQALNDGRSRPRLIVFDGTLTTAPQPILDYIFRHYRRARGNIFERIE